jgi:hypothetical protein
MSTLKDQFQRARIILQSLGQGLHPKTGVELPQHSVINQIDVSRAMATAVPTKARISRAAARREVILCISTGVSSWVHDLVNLAARERSICQKLHGTKQLHASQIIANAEPTLFSTPPVLFSQSVPVVRTGNHAGITPPGTATTSRS